MSTGKYFCCLQVTRTLFHKNLQIIMYELHSCWKLIRQTSAVLRKLVENVAETLQIMLTERAACWKIFPKGFPLQEKRRNYDWKTCYRLINYIFMEIASAMQVSGKVSANTIQLHVYPLLIYLRNKSQLKDYTTVKVKPQITLSETLSQ